MTKEKLESLKKAVAELNAILHVGYIYIMVNPGWQDKVKIGYADDLEKRRRDFSGTGFPDPSHVYAAYAVKERLEDTDIHNLIDELNPEFRYDKKKEFYTMSPEQAYRIFERIANVSGTMEALKKNPLNDAYFSSPIVESRSSPAPIEQQKKQAATQLSQRQMNNMSFWEMFNDALAQMGNPFRGISKVYHSWQSVAMNTSKYDIELSISGNKHKISVFYLMRGKDKATYDKFLNKKSVIESRCGFDLEWNRNDGQECALISRHILGLDFNDKKSLPEFAKNTVQTIVAMKNAVQGLDLDK